ncbi:MULTISPECIES: antifreeze protein [Phyllobacterium]|uniref:Antifreeze protein n=1 Tax=Phyllobacterium sophorae TaxID=1520277 RepID=A0A2P7BDW4_9HYPH|nr:MULTISPECIES: antifreeze protein [Phyllobacterium]PSH64642.1 antifreeze protein [Phyllobacterium sophorae]UXN64912.1 antifreeze protein [Phyllobacterium sp. A18/5-2]
MKKIVLALTASALLVTGFASSAMADGRYYREGSPAIYMEDGVGADGYLVQDRRYYEDGYREDRRYDRRDRFGPRDVARMLERRGYRVRDVNFERGRYFVRTSRRGAPVLVVVSRRGEILETRRMGGDRYGDRRQNGFSIEINPAY